MPGTRSLAVFSHESTGMGTSIGKEISKQFPCHVLLIKLSFTYTKVKQIVSE